MAQILITTFIKWGLSKTVATIFAHALLTVGTSLIASALAPKLTGGERKLEMEFGDNTPLTFTVGRAATAGKRKYIGQWGSRTVYITEVIEYSCLPQELDGFWINEEKGEFDTGKVGAIGTGSPSSVGKVPVYNVGSVPGGHFEVGTPINNYKRTSDGLHAVFIKVVPGTQVAADPFLVKLFGTDPDFPWTAEFVGTGKSYAIVTTRYVPNIMTSYPGFIWEPAPLKLYDVRKDSTNGGSGSHRWDDDTTWEATENGAVIAYHLTRGLYYGNEWIFGGKNLPAWRLPSAAWIAAANAQDDLVDVEGVDEPAYRAGMEIAVDMFPAEVLSKIGLSTNMQFVPVGGVLKPQVGLPAAAVLSITDKDIIITQSRLLQPFKGISENYNSLSAIYPEPEERWASKDAPEYVNAEALADDNDDYRPTSIAYTACPYISQVQRLLQSQMLEYRRDRIHQIYLPPIAYKIEPLVDMISWTSEYNGYTNKKFLVDSIARAPGMAVLLTLREVDPADYDPPSVYTPVPINPPIPYVPATAIATGIVVEAVELLDTGSVARLPAIKVTVASTDDDAVESVIIRVRRDGETNPFLQLEYPYASPYYWYISQVVGGTDYEVQVELKLYGNVTGIPSSWYPVTTTTVLVLPDAIDSTVWDQITEIAELAGITTVASLPPTGDAVDQIVMLVPPGRLYRWTGSAWSTAVYGGIEDASLTTAAFASSIRPVELAATLPSTGNFAGRVVFLTTDNKIYRHNGTAWTVSVDGGDILAGSIIAGKIAVGAVSAAELSIGFGANWLSNPDFFSGVSGWQIFNSGDPVGVTTLALRGPGTTWSGLQYPTLMVYQSTAGSTGFTNLWNGPVYDDSGNIGAGYPVKPGDRLQMFAQFSLHRCTGHRWIQWLDAAGNPLAFSSLGDIPEGASDSANPDLWPVYGGFGIAPANAAYARPFIRKLATTSGANSYMFVHKPFLGPALANQTAFSPWDAGRATKIDGNRLVSDTVEARHMKADSVTTNALVAGAVVASKIGAGEVIAGKLGAGAINAGSLIVDGVISKRKVMDYTTYAVLPTGVAGTVPASFITIGTVDFAVAPYVSIGGQYYNPGVWQISGEVQLQFGQGASIYLALQSQPVGGGAWTTHFTLDIYMGSSSVFFQRITDFTGVFSSTTRTYRAVAWCRAGSLPPYLRNAHALLEQVSK